MPKQKTRKSVLKKFKITATGKIMRGRQYSRHRKAHKSSTQKNRYGKRIILSNKQAKVIKSLT